VTQNQQVAVQGVLSIARVKSLVNFGTVTKGFDPSPQDVGELDYTNTQFDTNPPWNVTVQTTALTRTGTAPQPTIPYANEQFAPGTTITSDTGSTGSPTASSTPVRFGGAGTTSDPVTVATAAGGTYGTFHQTGSNLILSVPLSVRPGTYTGTLTYTITG
jgi:hypothetical protein